MRINQLPGWPPSRFQAAEARGIYTPASSARLELLASSLLPSISRQDSPEVFLLLSDPETEEKCSVRFKVKDAGTAIGLAKALSGCSGRCLKEIGAVQMKEESETFPGLKKIL